MDGRQTAMIQYSKWLHALYLLVRVHRQPVASSVLPMYMYAMLCLKLLEEITEAHGIGHNTKQFKAL